YALLFSPSTLLKAVWIREAQFIGCAGDPLAGGAEWIATVTDDELRERLQESLVAATEPVVAALRTWSGYSRHALWAMVTSSWAAQFANVARQLGDERRGLRAARAVLARNPEIARAAPILYAVEHVGVTRTCQ